MTRIEKDGLLALSTIIADIRESNAAFIRVMEKRMDSIEKQLQSITDNACRTPFVFRD